MKHLETMISVANEARHKAQVNGDPLWHAVADFEVERMIQLWRSTESDESCGYVAESVVEFAPIWKEALPDAIVLGPPSRSLLSVSSALPSYRGEVAL